MGYVTFYALCVTWIAAALLYSDGYLVHSKKEVVLAPLIIALTTVRSVVVWCIKKYDYHRGY